MSLTKPSQSNMQYLNMQAEVGITKHVGGFAATDELLALCHIENASEVLNVGCGIGVGVAYIAKRYGCHVVGVDISEKMISWSRLRAREEKIEALVEFHVANVLELPFEADRFDVVIVESVLAFVDDKSQAIRECMRVAKPGGYIGLNESFWTKEPSPEMVTIARDSIGSSIPTKETWQELWELTRLQERISSFRQVDSRAEIRDRLRWVGPRWALRGFGRLLRLFFTNPKIRRSVKVFFGGSSLDSMEEIGYGLFTGRKPGE
jgi:ubiquinone/menaquinone biosynthesis C-methylase UbiE